MSPSSLTCLRHPVRANILRTSFRELGIGVRPGVPTDAGAGGTYTTDFGVKL